MLNDDLIDKIKTELFEPINVEDINNIKTYTLEVLQNPGILSFFCVLGLKDGFVGNMCGNSLFIKNSLLNFLADNFDSDELLELAKNIQDFAAEMIENPEKFKKS
jgi:hypothetical protein